MPHEACHLFDISVHMCLQGPKMGILCHPHGKIWLVISLAVGDPPWGRHSDFASVRRIDETLSVDRFWMLFGTPTFQNFLQLFLFVGFFKLMRMDIDHCPFSLSFLRYYASTAIRSNSYTFNLQQGRAFCV
eukprot:jgi/Botrbrau1/8569/Bobra.0359s0033.1